MLLCTIEIPARALSNVLRSPYDARAFDLINALTSQGETNEEPEQSSVLARPGANRPPGLQY
jgi:hypothetical protein